MEEEYQEYELIEQYLKGQLTGPEKETFQERLRKDSALRQKVEQMKGLYEGFDELHIQFLAEEFGQWQMEAKTVSIRRYARWWLWGAVASILLIGVLVFWNARSYSNSALVAQHFIPFEGKGDVRGFEATTDNRILEGLDAYEKGEYQVAIDLLSILQPEEKYYKIGLNILAYCYFQEGQYDDAIRTFSLIAQSEDSRFAEVSEWNLVLSYLAKGQLDDPFDQSLDAILAKKSHLFYHQAQNLQQKLSSFWRKLSFS